MGEFYRLTLTFRRPDGSERGRVLLVRRDHPLAGRLHIILGRTYPPGFLERVDFEGVLVRS